MTESSKHTLESLKKMNQPTPDLLYITGAPIKNSFWQLSQENKTTVSDQIIIEGREAIWSSRWQDLYTR